MKLAVLADIHGNWPALEAVAADIARWQPDMVLVNGDVVNGGPSSDVCWRFVRERQAADGWLVLRGNHEEYVVGWSRPDQPMAGPAYELSRLSHWTFQQLGGEVTELAALPERWQWIAPNGSRLVAMHASLLGNRAGLYPHTSEADAARMVDTAADVFVTSHTHIPLQRQTGPTRVINTGAVGLTGDGDTRAAYGRLTWERANDWQLRIRRVAYDTDAAERAFTDSGFLAEAGPLALMTLVELRTARDAKTRWTAIYRPAILAGSISVEDAVYEFLDQPEFRPYSRLAKVWTAPSGSHFL